MSFLMNFSRDSREICGETLKGYEVKILQKILYSIVLVTDGRGKRVEVF